MSVYVLKDPRDGRCRYVGMSRRPQERFLSHLADPTSRGMRQWIAELGSVGAEPVMAILAGGTEASWIERLRPDLNVKPGNEDVDHPSARETVATLEFSDEEWFTITQAADFVGLPALLYASSALVKAARAEIRKAGKTPATG